MRLPPSGSCHSIATPSLPPPPLTWNVRTSLLCLDAAAEYMTLGAQAILIFMAIVYFFALVISDIENNCSQATAYWECSVPFHTSVYFVITVCHTRHSVAESSVLID